MKKIVYLFLSVLALGFASCEKDTDAIFLKASMETPTHQGKTTLNGNVLRWEQNDMIKVQCSSNGTSSAWYDFRVSSSVAEEATTATFVSTKTYSDFGSGDFEMFQASGASFNAIYPSSAMKEDGTVTLPRVQQYREGGVYGFPMFATNNGNSLKFKNACGLLKVSITGPSTFTATDLVLYADEAVCGTVNPNTLVAGTAWSISSDPSDHVILSLGSVTLSSTAQDFYIYLPAGEYHNVKLALIDANGNAYAKKAGSGQTLIIARSKITTLPCEMKDSPIAAATLDGSDLYSSVLVDVYTSLERFIVKYGCSQNEFTALEDDPNYVSYGTGIGSYYDERDNTCYLLTTAYQINGINDWTGLFEWNPFLTYVDFGDYFNLSGLDMSYLFVTNIYEDPFDDDYNNFNHLEYIYLGKKFGTPNLATYNIFGGIHSTVNIYCSQETKTFFETHSTIANLQSGANLIAID